MRLVYVGGVGGVVAPCSRRGEGEREREMKTERRISPKSTPCGWRPGFEKGVGKMCGKGAVRTRSRNPFGFWVTCEPILEVLVFTQPVGPSLLWGLFVLLYASPDVYARAREQYAN